MTKLICIAAAVVVALGLFAWWALKRANWSGEE